MNKDLCVGCGLCEENLPELFKTGDYTADLITDNIPEMLIDRLEDTVEDCPAGAISISEESDEA